MSGVHLLIVLAARYLYLVVAAIGVVVWLTRRREEKLLLGLTTAIAGGLGLLLIVVASNLYVDQRPFAVHHVVPLIPHAVDNGFPSDHTTLSMVIALSVLAVSWRWGLVAVVAALGVGVARVAAEVHSPIDIAGAVLIALIAVVVGRLIAVRAAERLGERIPALRRERVASQRHG